MHARSALFDVYGDHLSTRGDRAPVAALVRMLEPVGIAAPAVRTAISRMVQQGWLTPILLEGGRGYVATTQAERRLDEARARIYRTLDRDWDGSWHLVVLDPVGSRTVRTRVRDALQWIGYAELVDGVWLSPWPHPELDELLAREGVTAARAAATAFHPPDRPTGCWNLAELGGEYAAWLDQARTAPWRTEIDDGDQADFAHRFHLVHEWRNFLFRDPGLPDALLPADWPGREAAEFFTAEAARLKPGADRFVDRCLTT
ncbi:PaaX family transcriptional regulator [Nocardioides jensenii]|uniref:PaaX family transcriptional regulator n=1 Tax=Nocardioides jensenii TaxID=1843 RepID=UPI000836D726|nr:PaaX family transcriptional regulator C-terminal domain-containing protein [Nocardioides jensenii]